MDGLSINVKLIKDYANIKDKGSDQESVASIITKGGTVINPFSMRRNSSIEFIDKKYIGAGSKNRSSEKKYEDLNSSNN